MGERLSSFLNINPNESGVIGGGKRKPTGVIDVALIQSLVRNGEVADYRCRLWSSDCRRMPSPIRRASSRACWLGRSKARYVVGLSATVAPKGRTSSHHLHAMRPCSPSGRCKSSGFPNVAFATARAIARRNLNCRRPWRWPNARQCRRFMQPWRRTVAGMT